MCLENRVINFHFSNERAKKCYAMSKKDFYDLTLMHIVSKTVCCLVQTNNIKQNNKNACSTEFCENQQTRNASGRV